MGTKSIINKEPVDIIIPTMDNPDQLFSCVRSMWRCRNQYPIRLIIVNNGKIPLQNYFPDSEDRIILLSAGENLGWTGALKAALDFSKSKYVVFANDDIVVPMCSFRWISQMVRHLELSKNCAAVGPTSNVVMGAQNIFVEKNFMCYTVPYLIGFCMMVRRSTLDEVGGIDEEFKTGDDIDLSIRFTKAGYHMIVDGSIFVYHHGFQTGEKVYGKPDRPGGWNSRQMTDDTNMHLIRKHGFLEWWYLRAGYPEDYFRSQGKPRNETSIVLGHVNGCDPSRIVDLGCGGSKTVKESIGVDILPKGESVPNTAYASDADIQADVEKRLPFEDGQFKLVIGRHILEHCTDTIGALQEWRRILADDGRMILALPDERISDTIILNPEHVHAFTPETLTKFVRLCGFRVEHVDEFYDDDSFVMVLGKEVRP